MCVGLVTEDLYRGKDVWKILQHKGIWGARLSKRNRNNKVIVLTKYIWMKERTEFYCMIFRGSGYNTNLCSSHRLF